MGPSAPEETRAETARRRLAELAAAFNASLPEEDPEPSAEPEEPRRSLRGVLGVPQVRLLGALAAIGGVVLGWWLLSGAPEAGNPVPTVTVASAGESGPKEPDPAPEVLIIDVAGKVKKPGIVTLDSGARVHDAIKAAGGVRKSVDLSDLNLARVLSDGEQLRVGLTPSPGAGAGDSPGSTGTPASPVNLNSAGTAELETLPGVGPVTAQSIVDWRTANGRFATVDNLIDVREIDETTLERLRRS